MASCRSPQAACPDCQVASQRVHSRYQRRLADAAVGGREMVVRLATRRFITTVRKTSKLLEPYKPHLRRRTTEGCISTQTLLSEIRALGYRGCERTLRRWLIRLRGAIAEPETPNPVKVRDFVVWIMRPHEKLTETERLELKRVCATNDELATTRDLARRFNLMLRERQLANPPAAHQV